MKRTDTDFRQTFARMAPQAIVTRDELAALLATTVGAITQMAYRGELPRTAFPDKRRACWFAGDIRQWLDSVAADREGGAMTQPSVDTVRSEGNSAKRRVGRPRASLVDAR
jgi:hypothetical protein